MQTQMSTSMEYFISGIKNEKTKSVYLYQIEQFRDHFEIQDFDSLLKISPDEIKRMVEQFVVSNKNKGLTKSSINNKIFP